MADLGRKLASIWSSARTNAVAAQDVRLVSLGTRIGHGGIIISGPRGS